MIFLQVVISRKIEHLSTGILYAKDLTVLLTGHLSSFQLDGFIHTDPLICLGT